MSLAFGTAMAAPPAGTTIPNQATASGQQAASTLNVTSNTVTATVGTAAGGTPGGMLEANRSVTNVVAGSTVYARHTLTNTGTAADSFTLSAADLGGGYAFASISFFADANDDGLPDNATPLGALALAPGQAFHFVVAYAVPPNAGPRSAARARIAATSVNKASVGTNTDEVIIKDSLVADCAALTKALSRSSGASPAGPVTVTLGYQPCDKARGRIVITDHLPAGMHYVAGSGRWSAAPGMALSDGVSGDDLQGSGGTRIAYDWNVTSPGAVTATVVSVPAGGSAAVSFDVEIDAGVALGTVISNTADAVYFDTANVYGPRVYADPVTYTVNARVDLELVGQRLPTVMPGTNVIFSNVLTNKGTATETFDITLANSTFPAGTTLALFKSDGTTPLADTDGNGTADTGPVAPGASYTIIVRARLPETTPPAAYKVTKVARAASAPMRTASADDAVDTVAFKCALVLEPDNQATIGRGQHVTYTHYLTNRGNCAETVTAAAGYLADAQAAWQSAPYLDTPTAGNGSLPGALDATDAAIKRGWSTLLQPGDSRRVLVDVLSPSVLAAKKAAKALADSDVTTLVLTGSGSGNVTVRDTTLVDDKDEPAQPANSIRNFTDSSYQVPTLWGVIGSSLWLRADASSCNAVPDVVEKRTVVITGPNGEREEITATETGPNTGIFVMEALPVRAPPVVAGDHVIEGGPNDVFDVQMLGCGQRVETVVTLMDPQSVVFDSRTNDPVAGARVTLVTAEGSQCTSTAANVGSAANPATTDAAGRFAFPALPAGRYCLSVQPPNGYHAPSQVAWPQLPATRNLNVTGPTSGGSYGGVFALGTGGLVVIDIPVDATGQDGLFVQKEASRLAVEIGDFVDYTVRVRNNTGNVLDRADVTVTDDLPAGFAYVAGTARRDGVAIADPVGGAGPHLALAIGHLARDAEVLVTYRVRVGPGAMQGDGVNRAQAIYVAGGIATRSNVAAAKVRVTGGVFTEQGFILGKVHLDCNADGVQEEGEAGVAGVRVLLEDGTYVITDGEGRFSFYGIANRTHVVKVDRTTLPPGARLVTTSARNLGDGRSRMVDLKAGALGRADFAIAGCDDAMLEDVRARAIAAAQNDEIAALAGAQLTTEARVITDSRALPASGLVSAAAAPTLPGAAAAIPGAAPGAGFGAVAPTLTPERPTPAPQIVQPASPVTAEHALEAVLPDVKDNKLAFLAPKDGETLAYAQANVRVKGLAGTTFRLTVNGVEVSEKRVGKRALLAERQLQAWEYIGVELKPGENTLVVTTIDPFGNARGSETLHVVAPDKLGRVTIEVPRSGGIADGKTPAHVVVKLTDANGVPVTVRTAVTLEATVGKWQADDLDPVEPGVQQFIENGRGEFLLAPPIEPGPSRIVVTSGAFKSEATLDFLPELRSLVATGVIEGVVNVRHLSRDALAPTRASDGFEQEIRQLSREWGKDTQAGARAAFYLKGKIRGDYLLTAAYDSDKDTQERLFRDIQPDEFYPVYGDSGVRGFDAQSTSKLYVRIDNKRSYLLWGDFTTAATSEARKLTNYSRSLTGAREHYENDRVMVTAFASRDSTRQVIEELRANGTSGPFQLGTQGALVNSEKVEIITRDRNQPAIILQSVPQARFADYEIEVLTGRILFKAPVASVDSNLNPVFIRVTYEVDQGGEQFWVVGVDGQVKVTDRVQVGAIYVKDKNPLLPFTLAGANLAIKVGESTYIISEAARTETGLDETKGNAGRIEVKHEGTNLKANAFVAKTDVGFNNPGSYLSQGRGEAGGKLDYQLTERARIHAEALRTEDETTHAVREGATLSIHYQIAKRISVEVGMRHATEKGDLVASPIPPVAGQPLPEPVPDEVTTVRARVNAGVPGVENAAVYAEGEVDVHDADKKILAVGGEYTLPNKGRIYGRHEFISSITGPYGLDANQRQNTTAIGIDTEYMKDGRVFSEYRIRDAMSGGDVEAALGLKNLWSIAPGLKLGTTFERIQAIAGTGQDEATAVALALEYTGSDRWKGSTRLEVRDGKTQDSLLFTVGLAARLNKDWTALARNAYNLTRTEGAGDHVIERMQAGLAWRDTRTNRWNMLARVEHRMEHDDSTPGLDLRTSTQILSVHADWQPRRPFLVSGRYAAKWSRDDSNGLSTRYHAQVVGARATYEFASKWDVGVVTSLLAGEGTQSKQYGVGFEVGYLVAQNLWVSAGYNVVGYRDADMAGADYTAKGPFVRLRYKFDEDTLAPVAKKVGAQ